METVLEKITLWCKYKHGEPLVKEEAGFPLSFVNRKS